jgi:hypothetical protein
VRSTKPEGIANYGNKNRRRCMGFVKQRDLKVSETLPEIPPKKEDLRTYDTFSERGHFRLFIYVVFKKCEKDFLIIK